MPRIVIGLVGDRDDRVTAHRAIPKALAREAETLDRQVEPRWIPTASLESPSGLRALRELDGLWCVPASPYRSFEGALAAIRFARVTPVPFLGTCGGFQHALVEYARNVLGLADAGHAEVDPRTPFPLVAPLACELVERDMDVHVLEGTRLREICGPFRHEEYRCRYGLAPAMEEHFAGRPLRIAARDSDGEARAFELDGHPFYFGTLFQPERGVLRSERHPLVTAFVAAAARHEVRG